jgi:hypothetical protein
MTIRKRLVIVIAVIALLVAIVVAIVVADISIANKNKKAEEERRRKRVRQHQEKLLELRRTTHEQQPVVIDDPVIVRAGDNLPTNLLFGPGSGGMLLPTITSQDKSVSDDGKVPVRDTSKTAKPMKYLAVNNPEHIGGGKKEVVFAPPDDSRLPKWSRNNVPERPTMVPAWAKDWDIPDTKALFERAKALPHPLAMQEVFRNVKSSIPGQQAIYGLMSGNKSKNSNNRHQMALFQGFADEYDDNEDSKLF